MTTILQYIQLFVHYIDGVIGTALLFLLQGMYQIYPAKKEHKHTQFYLLFIGNTRITSSL